jgi:hypothetical protein
MLDTVQCLYTATLIDDNGSMLVYQRMSSEKYMFGSAQHAEVTGFSPCCNLFPSSKMSLRVYTPPDFQVPMSTTGICPVLVPLQRVLPYINEMPL